MINIWEFADTYRVSITTTDGSVYAGRVLAVWDSEESMQENGEDSIDIELDNGQIYGFTASEIQSIQEAP